MGRGTMADGMGSPEAGGCHGGAQEAREATTLSTIAVQSGTTRIVIALLQVCEGWRQTTVEGRSADPQLFY